MQGASAHTFLEQYSQPNSPSDTREEKDYRAFSFGRVGSRAQPMLTFVKSDDYVEAISYANLNRVWSANIDREIKLDFGERHVSIEGQQLRDLFRYICANRCSEIVERSPQDVMCAEPQMPIVTQLRFEPCSKV